jgi:hypothetical protein
MALSIVYKPVGDLQLLGEISTGEFRPLLLSQFSEAAFFSLHNIALPGIRTSCRLVSSRFFWPHLSKQVAAQARACLHCQRNKVHKHVHLQPEQVEVPRRRFAHVHVDLVGPLPRSAVFSYLLTVLDITTSWPEAIPLATITAADCAAGLFHVWVQRFSLPATITSERGPQFASSLWAALCSLLNITIMQTTAYHPQANGAGERFHCRLKDALRACAAGTDWHAHLPWALPGISGGVRLSACTTRPEPVLSRAAIIAVPQRSPADTLQQTTAAGGPPQPPGAAQSSSKNCCSLALFWYDAIALNRRCRQCTTAHIKFWRGPVVFSKSRWEPGKTQSQLFT